MKKKKSSSASSMVPKPNLKQEESVAVSQPEGEVELDAFGASAKKKKNEAKNRKRKMELEKKEVEKKKKIEEVTDEDGEEVGDQEEEKSVDKAKISIKMVKERLTEENRYICGVIQYLRIPTHKNQNSAGDDEDDSDDGEGESYLFILKPFSGFDLSSWRPNYVFLTCLLIFIVGGHLSKEDRGKLFGAKGNRVRSVEELQERFQKKMEELRGESVN